MSGFKKINFEEEKMKKRIIGILFAAMVVLLLGVSVAGCGYKPHGAFYSLQEAYDAGYITRADLEEIAERQNDWGSALKEELDPQVKQMICEDEADRLRNLEEHPIPEAEASGVWIVHYYGVYQEDFYAVMLSGYTSFPAVVIPQWEHIDGVDILYIDPLRIKIWKKN